MYQKNSNPNPNPNELVIILLYSSSIHSQRNRTKAKVKGFLHVVLVRENKGGTLFSKLVESTEELIVGETITTTSTTTPRTQDFGGRCCKIYRDTGVRTFARHRCQTVLFLRPFSCLKSDSMTRTTGRHRGLEQSP